MASIVIKERNLITMVEAINGGDVSYSYNNANLDYNIVANVDDDKILTEFKAIKELLIEQNLMYVTGFIRELLNIKVTDEPTCFSSSLKGKKPYQNVYGKKTILYLRLSIEDIERKDNSGAKTSVSKSILNQLLMLLQYCQDNNFEVVGIFYEEDISGGDENRPEWQKSLQFCENGYTDIYLCKTQARFARDVEMIERYLHKRFIEWNIRFLSIVDHCDTSVKGNKLLRQFTAIVDERKIEEQSINTKATLRGKNKAGLWTGSFACYGYIEDPNDQYHLIVDPQAGKVVRKIYELYAKGLGYAKIVKYLNERKIPTPSKHKYLQGLKYVCPQAPTGAEYWNTDTVRKILMNETYDGVLIQNRTETIAHNIKKKRKLPKSEQTIVACSHERIVDPKISRIVRAKFSARAKSTHNSEMLQTRAKPTKNGEVHIFSQKVYCACCGKILQKTNFKSGTRDNPTKKDYLKCRTRKKLGSIACANNSSIRSEVLEEVILNEINKQINKYYNQIKFNKSYYEKKVNLNYDEDIKILEEEKVLLDKKVKEHSNRFSILYEDRLSGIITPNEFIILKTKYDSEINTFNSRIIEINEEMTSLTNRKEQQKQEQNIFKEYKNLKTLDRLAIETFISKIVIGKINEETKQREMNIVWNICCS